MPNRSRTGPPSQASLPDGPISLTARSGALLAGLAIAAAAFAAYSNSFSGPFVLDDLTAVSSNATIRHLRSALSPPLESPLGGRPLLSLTFAANYALGGLRVAGYHALNLLIHATCGLALFGIARRTLVRPALRGWFGRDALALALSIACLWTVHPLQTEAVTYVSQRAESLMGLFYILTLYSFVRGVDSLRPGWWYALSVLSCLLGALTKEVIATAPLLVLLYDRTFCAGSLRDAWRLRWRYYIGLAAAWPLLARLAAGLGRRGVGYGYGMAWWNYALASCRSVALYLKLAVWPHPLVFDYGPFIIRHPLDVAPQALLIGGLLAFTAVALRRWPATGLACAWFFLVLAPTSSVLPVALQPTAESRAYLPLAGVVAMGVLCLYRLAGRGSMILFAGFAVGLGWLTHQRNYDYRSARALWSDTVAKRPENPRARTRYGLVLASVPGSLDQALAQYRAALRIAPDYAEAHNSLGIALSRIPGRLPEAISEYEAAIRIAPDYAQAHSELATALAGLPGRGAEAVSEYEAALRIDPDDAEAHDNLGLALAGMPGRLPEAIAQFEAAIRTTPDSFEARDNLGMALAAIPGRLPEAISEYEQAIRIKPDYAKAHNDLGVALANSPGRLPDAVSQFEEALRIRGDYADARANLEVARRMLGRLKEGRR